MNTSCRLVSVARAIEPNAALTHRFKLFAGPKRKGLLENEQYRLGELLYYGWPIFAFFAVPLTTILHAFYAVTFNYGLAIILLTVLVRGCMFPFSRKQAIEQQEDAGDPAGAQEDPGEIQKQRRSPHQGRCRSCYKKHNYNPLGGCLVVFIQMPIFIGLYRALMVDVELRDAPLFSHAIRWCSNLAAPDMLYDWSRLMPDWVNGGVSIVRAGALFQPAADLDHRVVPLAAEDDDAAAGRRAGRHDAEDDEVHDDLHGRDVLQGGQRPVHLLHRFQPVGLGRAAVPAENRAGSRKRRG